MKFNFVTKNIRLLAYFCSSCSNFSKNSEFFCCCVLGFLDCSASRRPSDSALLFMVSLHLMEPLFIPKKNSWHKRPETTTKPAILLKKKQLYMTYFSLLWIPLTKTLAVFVWVHDIVLQQLLPITFDLTGHKNGKFLLQKILVFLLF